MLFVWSEWLRGKSIRQEAPPETPFYNDLGVLGTSNGHNFLCDFAFLSMFNPYRRPQTENTMGLLKIEDKEIQFKY